MQICKNAMFFNAARWCSGGDWWCRKAIPIIYVQQTHHIKLLPSVSPWKEQVEKSCPPGIHAFLRKLQLNTQKWRPHTGRRVDHVCFVFLIIREESGTVCWVVQTPTGKKNGQECFRNKKDTLRMCACCHASVESVCFFMHLSRLHPAWDKKEVKKALPLYCAFSFNIQCCLKHSCQKQVTVI